MKNFYAKAGGILIGTEMALHYIHEPIENSVIASMDSLFSIPDFKINEKIMRLILRIRSLSYKQMILQTRNPEQKVFNYAIGGNLGLFYKDEIEDRKVFGYPPFSTMIKISVVGKKEEITEKITWLESQFPDQDKYSYPAFGTKQKGQFIMNLLLKIVTDKWPVNEIVEKLKELPQEFIVKVDPESIL